MSALLAPPYDVISEAGRQALAQKSPHNAVHLILPKDQAGGDSDGKYGVAAATLRQLLAQERCTATSSRRCTVTIRCFFAARSGRTDGKRQRWDDYSAGLHRPHSPASLRQKVVLPHERTLAGPKLDRLKLKRATRTHLSQVFGLYNDPARATDAAFGELESQAPDLFGTTEDGVLHRLWRLTDPRAIAEVCRPLRDNRSTSPTVITATRRCWRCAMSGEPSRAIAATTRRRSTDRSSCAMSPTPACWFFRRIACCTAWLVSICRAAQQARATLRHRRDPARLARDGAGAAAEYASGHQLPSGQRRSRTVPEHYARGGGDHRGPAVLRDLDVTVLHALVFESALGIDRAAQGSPDLPALSQRLWADRGGGDERRWHAGGVSAEPTRVEQVMAVAEASEVSAPRSRPTFIPRLPRASC